MGLFDGLTGSVPVPTSRYEAVDVINLKNLNQSFDTPKGKFTLFKDFSLDIKDFSGEGQFISILGKSGCGKSQLLKIISGLTQPDSGEVLVYGKPQTGKIPMVFQQYSSFPWQTAVTKTGGIYGWKQISEYYAYCRLW